MYPDFYDTWLAATAGSPKLADELSYHYTSTLRNASRAIREIQRAIERTRPGGSSRATRDDFLMIFLTAEDCPGARPELERMLAGLDRVTWKLVATITRRTNELITNEIKVERKAPYGAQRPDLPRALPPGVTGDVMPYRRGRWLPGHGLWDNQTDEWLRERGMTDETIRKVRHLDA